MDADSLIGASLEGCTVIVEQMSCLRTTFLVCAVALAQVSVTAQSTARDEAIPSLRDATVIVLKHARIIDGTGAPAKENQTLVVEGASIRAVGNDADIKVPDAAQTLDMAGRTVLPGLVMLHEHLMFTEPIGLTRPQDFSFPRLYLAFGVTTMRTAGTDYPYIDLNLKRRIDAGLLPGPEIYITSPYFSGEGDPFLGAMILKTPEEARRSVRYWAAEGFTWFKAYQWIQKDVLAALIDEAHRLGTRVTAHLRSVSCRDAADMGIDNIEHGCFNFTDKVEDDLNGPRTEDLVRALIQKGVVLTATPTSARKPLSAFAIDVLDPAARERLSSQLARLKSPPPVVVGIDSPYAHLLTAFVKAGGRLVLGSDAGGGGTVLAGTGDDEAIENLVRMGFPPLQAIRMATLDGATFLGVQERTGTIAAGKEADLLIVRGSPSEQISDIENVEMVFSNGVAYDPKMLIDKVKGQVGWR
jgi:imidazolonepropionase-like amidohydrolase